MSTKTSDIALTIEHVTRVEGHGNIVVNIKNGRLESCRFDVVEAPRFFEAMLKGRKYDEAAHIASRICGICSPTHTLASLSATEDALKIQTSEQTTILRKILIHGGSIQSHVLHAYFLAAPDFLGVGSVFPLIKSHPVVVTRALRMKKLGNDIADLIGGRAVHPISCVPGGFSKLPAEEELMAVKKRLEGAIPDLNATVELFAQLKVPDFKRETEYISLANPDEYPFYRGEIMSSDSGKVDIHKYLKMTNEFIVPHSTAKHTKASRTSFMVGALARFNNNYKQLSPLAKKAAKALKLTAPCYNPYMNTIAQVVETAHVAEDCIMLIDKLLTKGIKQEELPVIAPKAGTGVGAVEAPRGILYHEYTYDSKGKIAAANCIIPTNQNFANIEDDMKTLVPQIAGKPEKEVGLMLEMLVRAYDPCISCSVH